ncbi:hypothetical protein BKA15_006862 [Microlunatus parietis]|uniref:Uncharacterized protein n=1 Tax=Microlunatus parietis TaxID=682979 RepID=A0A7Y9IFF9_9ACTN|nr:hypothetical protein [Microlunatus parietis]
MLTDIASCWPSVQRFRDFGFGYLARERRPRSWPGALRSASASAERIGMIRIAGYSIFTGVFD